MRVLVVQTIKEQKVPGTGSVSDKNSLVSNAEV